MSRSGKNVPVDRNAIACPCGLASPPPRTGPTPYAHVELNTSTYRPGRAAPCVIMPGPGGPPGPGMPPGPGGPAPGGPPLRIIIRSFGGPARRMRSASFSSSVCSTPSILYRPVAWSNSNAWSSEESGRMICFSFFLSLLPQLNQLPFFSSVCSGEAGGEAAGGFSGALSFGDAGGGVLGFGAA